MKQGLLYTGLIVIGIAIVVGIFTYVGADKIISNLQTIGLIGFLVYFGTSLVVVALPIIGLHIILHSHNIKTLFWHTAIGQLIGNAIGFITPSMYLGGEPLKAHYIGDLYKTSKTKVFSIGIFGKFQELSSLLFFIYVGTLIMIIEAGSLPLPAGIWTLLLVVDISLGLFVIFAVRSIIKNNPVISNVIIWISRRGIFRKHIEKLIPKITRIEEMIYQTFKHDWKTGIVAYTFNFLSIVVAFIKPAVFFFFLYKYTNILSLTEIALIFTLSQILLVFHITPGCVGIFEGGQIWIFNLIGINMGDAASYLLVYRFVDLLITGGGIYLAIHYNLVKFVSARLETIDSSGEENNPNN